MNEETPRNHGLPWHPGDKQALEDMFCGGSSITRIANHLGRTVVSINCKLQSLGLTDELGRPIKRPVPELGFNPCVSFDQACSYAFQQLRPTQPAPQQKEQPMSFTLKVQSKTFINDTEVSTMTEEDFFNVIYRAEQEIERLDKIEHKPKAIQVKKAALIESIMVVVNILDARGA